MAAIPVVIAMLVTLWFASLGEPRVTGDEPHYLVMADGLVHDRTFDLRDAYTREGQTQRIYGSPLPAPHVTIINHRWGPYHEPGLAMLLALPFSVGGTIGARLALCLIAGALPLWVFKWLRARMPVSTAAWLTVGLTVGVPFSFGAGEIYPDLTAGVVAAMLLMWLLCESIDRRTERTAALPWAGFWLTAGLLPWLNVKFLAATAALALGAIVMLAQRERTPGRLAALATSALLLIGPVTLGLLHSWATGSMLGARGAAELTTSPGRAAMMLLGLHFDQSQGMFWQQPLLLVGVAAFVPFAWRAPKVAVIWCGLYLSLIVPDAFELARYGGGAPAGRFGWSAAWLWIVPLGFIIGAQSVSTPAAIGLGRTIRRIVCACLAYQALLSIRWLPNPHVLFPVLEENPALRDSLFPVALRAWVPSFYFWDFHSYWTYGPNLMAYAVVAGLLMSGVRIFRTPHTP